MLRTWRRRSTELDPALGDKILFDACHASMRYRALISWLCFLIGKLENWKLTAAYIGMMSVDYHHRFAKLHARPPTIRQVRPSCMSHFHVILLTIKDTPKGGK